MCTMIRVLVCTSFSTSHPGTVALAQAYTQHKRGRGRRIMSLRLTCLHWGKKKDDIACYYPSTGMVEAEDQEFRVTLSYIASTGQPGLHEILCLKKKKNSIV